MDSKVCSPQIISCKKGNKNPNKTGIKTIVKKIIFFKPFKSFL